MSVNFLAVGNADGSWFLQEVGDDVVGTAGVTVSETALTVTEEDATGDTYTVVLDSEPTANVVVTVGGYSSTDVTPAPATLAFTNLNWETAQTVTVKAGNDADTANDTVSLTHSAASTDSDYSGISIAGVTVTVNDNDTGQVTDVMVEPGDTELVVEWTAVGNATGYKVQWKSGGQSYSTSTRQATIASGSTTSYTIASLTNGTEYTVQVTATRTGFNDGPPSAEMTGTPEAPATAGVTVSEMALTVTEEDATGDAYTVVLDSAPTANVVVTVGGHSGTDVTPTPATLTFTNLNWETARTVTVKAGNDADTANDTVSLTHSAASTDSDYSGISITGVTVTEEDATGDTYTVVLDSEPTANVVVTVGGHSGTDVTPAPATLTFTNLNWETARTVTVTAGNDADTANDTVSLTHSAASTDSDYNGILIAGVTVTVNDNDTGPTTGICGHTEQVRDAILDLISGVTDCADVTDTHLAAIGRLNLNDKGITALAAGDFDELTALTTLSLSNNSLSTLPAGVFDELTSLEGLYLGNDSLTTLPDNVFDNNTELRQLYLHSISLTTLPDNVFDELTELTYLALFSGSLETLPAGVFDGLTALTELRLNHNSLDTLPAGVFDELTELTYLALFSGSLETLPAGVFDGLTALTELRLNHNSLTALPDDVFEELTALEVLDLSDNPGAPFSPTADAVPDDGEVPVAGGGRERGAVVRLAGDVQRGGEPDRGGDGGGFGQRHGRQRDGLRDPWRRG